MTIDDEIYGVDSVALLSYFVNKLGKDGDLIFSKAESNEARMIVPSIVIGESIYTILKERNIFGILIPREKVNYILDVIYQSPIFSIVDLTKDGWKHFLDSNIKGLHDRMIVSTCLQEGVVNLITKDEEIIKSKEIEVLW
ncbi:MAG: type II toxin-antitoxin system VapC family toxin [Candidatus Heimdallarchaeota archaeon]|nr:type II toxin-antitoxin system VapC family toxin [Candidatus Heimdallarchaeota archaeon]